MNKKDVEKNVRIFGLSAGPRRLYYSLQQSTSAPMQHMLCQRFLWLRRSHSMSLKKKGIILVFMLKLRPLQVLIIKRLKKT